ncbi:MAG: hypothetical protein WBC44_15205 [Planctomycetaceae bacterium]
MTPERIAELRKRCDEPSHLWFRGATRPELAELLDAVDEVSRLRALLTKINWLVYIDDDDKFYAALTSEIVEEIDAADLESKGES